MDYLTQIKVGDTVYGVKDANAIPTSQKGVANGVAALDGEGKIPAGQLKVFTTEQRIMTASGWSQTERYYTFEEYWPCDTYDISIEIDGDQATDAQLLAWSQATLCGSFSGNKVYAKGNIPSVNIPIILTAYQKEAATEGGDE